MDIKNLTKGDYPAEYQNWSVTEGPGGIMYFANNSGLLEYDGINWEIHTASSINNIRSVAFDPVKNRIYTAGYREIGFWERDSLGILQYSSLTEKIEKELLQNEEFWKIILYSGRVVFQSFNGIFLLENNTFRTFRPGGFLNTIDLIRDTLYLCLQNQGIFRFEDDSMVKIFADSILNEEIIRFLLPYGENNILVGTASSGLFLFDGKSLAPAFEEYRQFFQVRNINRGCLVDDSILVIGTILDGIIGFNAAGEKIFRINEETGLQNNTVLDLAMAGNNLWAALDRGISFIGLKYDPSYRIFPVKEIGAVYSAAIYGERFYLGTNQGLYFREIEETNDSFRLVPGTQGQVWDCKVIDDRLFVSHNSGAFMVNRNELKKISDINGGFSIIENPFRLNTLIQSTYSDLVFFSKESGEWAFSHTISNFNDLIRFVEMDHLGNLWASHMRRGVYKLRLNGEQSSVIESRYYGKNSVFGQEYGIHVFKLENRIVFTTGEKLFTYDDLNDSIISYDQVNNQIGEYAASHRIIHAGAHEYWFIRKGKAALIRFDPSKILITREFPLALVDNHLIEGFENIIQMDEFNALLCLENGYAILTGDQPDTRMDIRKFHPILKSFSIFGNSMTMERLPIDDSSFTVPYSKNNLSIRFAFPYFSSRNLKFSYKIEGLNENWSEPMARPEFQFNRFPSGDYVIHVKALNEWGESSPEYLLFVRIRPPWYFSVPSLVFYFLVVIGTILLVRYSSVKKAREKERKKQEVKEQELIRLRNENLQAELSYKSRELANSTMSIIKKNEFLLDLKEILKKQKYQLGTRYPDKYLDHVLRKIDRNISGGDDWKVFETNMEQAHEAFIQKMINKYPELSHSDLRLCTYLRMNLSSKEIAPLMRISVRGVENHRYKIRKKLELKPEENLTDFILGFEA